MNFHSINSLLAICRWPQNPISSVWRRTQRGESSTKANRSLMTLWRVLLVVLTISSQSPADGTDLQSCSAEWQWKKYLHKVSFFILLRYCLGSTVSSFFTWLDHCFLKLENKNQPATNQPRSTKMKNNYLFSRLNVFYFLDPATHLNWVSSKPGQQLFRCAAGKSTNWTHYFLGRSIKTKILFVWRNFLFFLTQQETENRSVSHLHDCVGLFSKVNLLFLKTFSYLTAFVCFPFHLLQPSHTSPKSQSHHYCSFLSVAWLR